MRYGGAAVVLVGFWGLACMGGNEAPTPEPEPTPAPIPEPPPVREQVQPVETRMGELERRSWLHLPDGDKPEKMPLLVVLGDEGEARRTAQLVERWFDQGVVFLFPDGRPGTPPEPEEPEGKSGKRGKQKERDKDKDKDEPAEDAPRPEPWTQADDLSFVEVVTDQIVRAHPIDPERVFVAGLGAGGELVFRLACSESSSARYAGFAPVAATLPRAAAEACPATGFPKPMLLIAGTEDDEALWTGDEAHLSVVEGAEVFARKDGCDLASAKEDLLDDVDASDETRVKRHTWTCGPEVVELLEISGGGHTWPRSGARPGTKTSRDIDTMDELADFFALGPAPTEAGGTP